MKDPFVHQPPFPKNYSDEFLVFDHGKGSFLWDKVGNKYLDFTSGIAVAALGHGNQKLARIAFDQMKKLTHVSNLYTTQPTLDLAGELVSKGSFAAVHLGNSGTEANEGAMKYARVYSLRTKGEGHHKFMCFNGAFHGRTLGALSVTPTEKYQKPYHPLVPGIEVGTYNDINCLNKLDKTFAGVILEPLQGEGGLQQISPEFAQALQKTCKDHDILIIADEIQCGLARTGSFFAYNQLGLQPDIVTLAKPLAGGLPISATLIPQKVNDQIHVGDHGTTFGGGPVTAAVALEVVRQISQPSFLSHVIQMGEILSKGFEVLQKDFSLVQGQRGLGLLRGLVLDLDPIQLGALIRKLQDSGLLILRAGTNVLRCAPALTISEKEISQGLEILHKTFKQI